MTECPICFAQVSEGNESKHHAWHAMNGLHSAECDLLRTVNAQRNTGLAVTIKPCSCGVG